MLHQDTDLPILLLKNHSRNYFETMQSSQKPKSYSDKNYILKFLVYHYQQLDCMPGYNYKIMNNISFAIRDFTAVAGDKNDCNDK